MRLKLLSIFLPLVFGFWTLGLGEENPKVLNANLNNSTPDGKKLYTQICLGCHQEDGSGVPSLNPPLTQTSYVLGDKNDLIMIVLKGLSGKVKIQGKVYSNIMASQSFLKDDQIASILTYVRSNFGNNASAISPEEVKLARAKL